MLTSTAVCAVQGLFAANSWLTVVKVGTKHSFNEYKTIHLDSLNNKIVVGVELKRFGLHKIHNHCMTN